MSWVTSFICLSSDLFSSSSVVIRAFAAASFTRTSASTASKGLCARQSAVSCGSIDAEPRGDSSVGVVVVVEAGGAGVDTDGTVTDGTVVRGGAVVGGTVVVVGVPGNVTGVASDSAYSS